MRGKKKISEVLIQAQPNQGKRVITCPLPLNKEFIRAVQFSMDNYQHY